MQYSLKSKLLVTQTKKRFAFSILNKLKLGMIHLEIMVAYSAPLYKSRN